MATKKKKQAEKEEVVLGLEEAKVEPMVANEDFTMDMTEFANSYTGGRFRVEMMGAFLRRCQKENYTNATFADFKERFEKFLTEPVT